MFQRRLAGASVVALLLLSTLVAGQQTPAQLEFLGVVPPKNDEYRIADNAFIGYLNDAIKGSRPGFKIEYGQYENYGDEIRAVTQRGGRPYLARMTPYAYVTAWMLGANFDVLGTYESVATGSTIYRSYFVVKKERFGERAATLDALREFLKQERATRPKFVYHDPFSTSSYFLPAMWLRRQLIFDMPASSGPLTAIEARLNGDSSGDSIDAVLNEAADFAAVWDGTKKKIEGTPQMAHLVFIPLPDPLPNDLLVASNTLDVDTKNAVSKAVAAMNGKSSAAVFKPVGDFKSWVKIQDAPDARQALANLRQMATAPVAPVVVVLNVPEKFEVPLRKALRLAYPEYVLYDPDFHESWDMRWTVREIHDGALELAVEMNGGSDVEHFAQRFPISYVSAEGDLTTRIMELIHARMNRVRYVWPYQSVPTLLGDLDYTLEPGTDLQLERITWVDPQRNTFKRSGVVPGKVETSDVYKVTLRRGDFSQDDFHNPLSNVAYRALLVRPSYESRTTRNSTVAFVVLLLLGGVGAGVDLRRKPKAAPPPAAPRTLDEECAATVRATHGVWVRPLNDADQLWCDREQIEDKIGELKTQGLVPMSIGGKVRYSSGTKVRAAISLAKGLVGVGIEHERAVSNDLIVDPREVGDTVRLGALLRLMVDTQLLSGFLGRPAEWDAMNRMVATTLGGATMSRHGALNAGDEAVAALAAQHVEVVLDDALEKWSLFRAEWVLAARGDQKVAVAEVPLPAPLELGREKARVQALRLTFDVPVKADLAEANAGRPCACWLLGKLLKVTAVEERGMRTLNLKFGAIALLGDASPFDTSPIHVRRS